MSSDPERPQPPVEVSGGQGILVGTGNKQVNQFINVAGPRLPSVSVIVGDVPQQPPAFQPRPDLIAALDASGPGVTVVRALTGMRGVGKTQVAAAYARSRINAAWPLVAWISATNTAQVLDGLALVATRLNLGEPGVRLEDLAVAVRHHLEADGQRCLLVFDNVTDLDGLAQFLPAAGQSRVVITSNQQETSAYGPAVTVDVFTAEEALAFLAQRTGRNDRDGARELAAELGWLPLALAQAAAVIAVQHLSYRVYLTRLRATPVQKYLKRVTGDPYPHGAAEAILLAQDAAADTDDTGLSSGLINVISLLSAVGVSRGLLYAAGLAGILAPPGSQTFTTRRQIDEAIGHLASASLLTFSGDDSTVGAHRLTIRITLERQARADTLTRLGARVSDLLENVLQSAPEPWRNRPAARDTVEQIMALYEHLAPYLREDDVTLTGDLLRLRRWAIGCLYLLGDSFTQAIGYGGPLVTDFERVLGPDHGDTMTVRNTLAAAYLGADRSSEAIPLFEKTLSNSERVLGPNHPVTLTSRSNLAAAYQAAGRLAEAIALCEQTLSDSERILGPDHPDTVTSRNNLGAAYRAAGRLAEAIPLLEQTLIDRERLLSPEHPDTMTTRDNLGAAYRAAGRLAEAIPLLEQTLIDRERVLGSEHPSTMTALGSLGSAYQAAGRLAEAIPLLELTLIDREQVLGSDHPDATRSRANLAVAYHAAGRLAEAIPLLEQALADSERVLGRDHLDTIAARNDMGYAYQLDGRSAEAIPLLKQTLTDRERVLRPDHPDTLDTRNKLGHAYMAARRIAEAVPLYEQNLARYERTAGADHPDTPRIRTYLAVAYHAVGRTAEAIPLLEQALTDCEQIFGPDHPDTMAIRSELAIVSKTVGGL